VVPQRDRHHEHAALEAHRVAAHPQVHVARSGLNVPDEGRLHLPVPATPALAGERHDPSHLLARPGAPAQAEVDHRVDPRAEDTEVVPLLVVGGHEGAGRDARAEVVGAADEPF
jgi:hypothetical protein